LIVTAATLPEPIVQTDVEAWMDARAVLTRGRLVQEQKRRIRLLETANLLPVAQREQVMKALAANAVRWINDWCWTLDPRNLQANQPVRVPIVLRPRQVEFIAWLENKIGSRQNGLVEKSRDEGMTWIICAYFVHGWLFKPGFKAGIGSRKLDLVDRNGDPDCIFEKIRFLIRNLPPWMQPDGYDERKHANFCRMLNPANGATLVGEGGDDIGRGGRNLVYFVDEHAKIANPELVDQSLSQNATTIIYGSTPRGVGNLFYQKRFGGKIPVFTFHWRDNPDKNWTVLHRGLEVHPWYEEQVLKLDDVSLAQEVDIDYTASVEGIVIPAKWVQSALKLRLERGNPITAGLDVADEGEDDKAATFREGPSVTDVTRFSGGIALLPEAVKAGCVKHGVQTLFYDRLGVGAAITATIAKETNLSFKVVGVANSERPTFTKYPDNPTVTAHDRFANHAAELWWRLRLRFQNTHLRFTGVKPDLPDHECISLLEIAHLPIINQVIAQLSQPTYEKTGVNDLIRVNKKGAGKSSPDLAESLMYAFANPVQVKRPQGTVSGSFETM
jgi:phage terminase large subunit